MKKLFLFSLILFWWCLMFPSNSYTTINPDYDLNTDAPALLINNKEVRFRLLDFFYQ